MRTLLRAPWLVAVPTVIACTALQLHERFTPMQGQVAAVRSETDGKADGGAEAEIAMYYEKAPEGFVLEAGEAVVQVGYPHVVLGRIDLTLNDGDCHPESENLLDRAAIFRRMRDRAYREGGNAVIFIHTASLTDGLDDCARITERREAGYAKGPWATGFIVRVVEEPKLDGLSEIDDEDAGIADGSVVGVAAPTDVHPDEVPAAPVELPPPPP